MRKFAVLASLAVSLFATPAFAQELPISEQGVTAEINSEFNMRPTYEFGFKNLAELIDMGEPLEAAHTTEDGTVVQLTSNGLAYYLPEENQASFTDGFNRAALTDYGLTKWAGENLVAPEPAPVPQAPVYSDPRSYLYAKYPQYATRIDCLARHESGWNAIVSNVIAVGREHATGLLQYLPSTWLTTPQGKAGLSIYDPYAQIDATAYMLSAGRAREWATIGFC